IFYSPAPTLFYSLSLHDALPISLAVSTARRKLTQAIESRTPVSIKSAVSPGSGTEEPASPRKQASTIRLKESSPSGERIGCRCRSEEHTSELQSRGHLVCRLLLE